MDFYENIRSGKTEAVEQMLKQDPSLANQQDEKGFPPIVLATYNEQPEVSKVLLGYAADIDAKDVAGNTALMGVCFKGNLEIARLLINRGADVNARNFGGATPLIFAAMFNQLEITHLLLENGADKSMRDVKGNTAYTYAQKAENPKLQELLKP